MTDEKESGVIERHGQTVISALILGGIIWTGSTLIEVRESVAVQQMQINALTTDVAEQQRLSLERTDERYRASDARRDFGTVNNRMDAFDRRIYGLEQDRRSRESLEPFSLNEEPLNGRF